MPTGARANRVRATYAGGGGESLPTIAARLGVPVSQIRWSNSNLIASDSIATGQRLATPPVPGIVVTTKATDTFDSLGAKYQVDPQAIIDYNRLRSTQLTAGIVLVIPGGVGGAFPPPPALWQILAHSGTGGSFGAHVVGCCLGPYPATGFPVGWCTWYVATKRNVTWRGDAGFWYANASAQGYPVGPTPKVGAIM